MQRRELLRVVRALVEQPTAPFHEEAVRDAIVAEFLKILEEYVEARYGASLPVPGDLIAR